MKNLMYGVIIGCLFYGCDKKCHDITYNGYLAEMDKYFGMYVPGNWWVYYNQDSSKRDSIYVDSLYEKIWNFPQYCVQFPERNFSLSSIYLFTGSDSSQVKGYFISSETCCYNSFGLGNTETGFETYMDNTTSEISVFASEKTLISEIQLNGLVFTNVLFIEHNNAKVFFAPDVGLIQFINLQDTFSITNYQIQ